MFKKSFAGGAARLAAAALVLQACTPNTPKANVPDGSITGIKIAGDAIISSHIVNGTIVAADIADGTITAIKLDPTINLAGVNGVFTGTLSVTGASTLTGATTVGSTLAVTGATTVASTLGITGAATFSSTITGSDTLAISKASTATAAGNVYGSYSFLTASPTAASAGTFRGGHHSVDANTGQTFSGSIIGELGVATNSSTGAVAAAYGVYGQVANTGASPATITSGVGTYGLLTNSSTGDVTTGYGVAAGITNSSTGIVTNAYGVAASITNSGAGTITTGYALSSAYVNSGGGTFTTYHGLHLFDPGTGLVANKYNIYSDGVVRNYIAGRLGVAQLAPAYQIDVTGDINATNSLLINSVTMCTAAGCTAVSDMSLKEDVKPLESSLEKVLGLKGISYYFKDKKKFGASRQIGFSAQDLEKSFPQVVRTDERNGLKSVAYGNLIAPLVEAVKEIYAKWSQDHKELAQQKQQLASLERKIEIENVALKMENQALKNRLEKIEQALAQASPDKSLKPAAKRKLASVK